MSSELTRGVGHALAVARQAKGLGVETVAEKLKLTVRQVEAIEAEDFAHLPAPVFVRGFVRNYARLLGLEPEALLASLDVEQKPTETLTAPSEGVKFDTSPMRKWLLVPLLLLLLFLLLVAGLYAWLSQGEDALVSTETVAPVQGGEPAPVPPPAQSQPLPPAAVPVVPVVPVEPVVPPAAEAQVPPTPAPLPAAQPAPLQAPPPAPVQPAPGKPVPGPGGSAMLRFQVEDDAWIQVVDGAGQRYSRLVRAGSSESLQGKPPFRLVVGNAALVKLEYNNHVIDLKPFIGEKVARLTLE